MNANELTHVPNSKPKKDLAVLRYTSSPLSPLPKYSRESVTSPDWPPCNSRNSASSSNATNGASQDASSVCTGIEPTASLWSAIGVVLALCQAQFNLPSPL
jgi:hypothetical protein